MGKKGAPRGNANAKRGTEFRDALRKVVCQDKTALRRIAQALVEKAAGGDIPAIKEIADRLDGKPVPAVVDKDDTAPFKITLRIADHNGAQ